MAIATTDSTQVVYEVLTGTGTDLYTLIGTRAYSPVAPAPGVWSNATPAIVFRPIREATNASGGLDYVEMRFLCYGGTGSYKDARTVYRALRDRMEHSRARTVTSGRLERAFLVGGHQEPLEPDTGWPSHSAVYRLVLK